MIIIMSPSKTMDFTSETQENSPESLLNKKTNIILEKLKTFSKEEVSKLMNLKGKLLENTYLNIQNFENNPRKKAISSYTGTVFKEIKEENYSQEESDFLKKHLIILSAFYGIVSPFDSISPYRLDATTRVFEDISLYSFWKEFITDELNRIFENNGEKFLIDLASSEFIKMIDKKKFKYTIISVDFKEYKNGKYTSVSTYSKKARGMMIDYLVRKKSESPEDIKSFDLQGYSFNPELSTESRYVFTR